MLSIKLEFVCKSNRNVHNFSGSKIIKIHIKTPTEEKMIEVDQNSDIKKVILSSLLVSCWI